MIEEIHMLGKITYTMVYSLQNKEINVIFNIEKRYEIYLKY